jgi:hypothetical protein
MKDKFIYFKFNKIKKFKRNKKLIKEIFDKLIIFINFFFLNFTKISSF